MNKLVRDKIPDIMKNKKQKPKTIIIKDDSQYLSALNEKLVEEVNEYLESSSKDNSENTKYEIADILGSVEFSF